MRPAELVTERGEPLDPLDTLSEPPTVSPLELFEPLLDRDRTIRLPVERQPCLGRILYSNTYTMIGITTNLNILMAFLSPPDV